MRATRTQNMVSLFVVVVALSAGACGGEGPAPAATSTAADSNSVDLRFAKVAPGTGAVLVEAPAHVLAEPSGVAVVTAPDEARVADIKIAAGDTVDVDAEVATVIAPSLAVAAGELLAARTRVEAFEKRQQELEVLREQGLSRREDRANVEIALAQARAEEVAAAARLKAAGVGRGHAAGLAASGGRLALKSPIAGVVTEVRAVLGDGVGPSEPLVRIASTRAGRIEARLPAVTPGAAAFTFTTADGTSTPVRLVRRGPEQDPVDGTVRAWFEGAAAGTLLDASAAPASAGPAPGAIGVIEVKVEEGTGIVRVPERSVSRSHDRAEVVARRDGKLVLVDVRVLGQVRGEVLVEGDLHDDDEVALPAERARELVGATR